MLSDYHLENPVVVIILVNSCNNSPVSRLTKSKRRHSPDVADDQLDLQSTSIFELKVRITKPFAAHLPGPYSTLLILQLDRNIQRDSVPWRTDSPSHEMWTIRGTWTFWRKGAPRRRAFCGTSPPRLAARNEIFKWSKVTYIDNELQNPVFFFQHFLLNHLKVVFVRLTGLLIELLAIHITFHQNRAAELDFLDHRPFPLVYWAVPFDPFGHSDTKSIEEKTEFEAAHLVWISVYFRMTRRERSVVGFISFEVDWKMKNQCA